MAVERVQGSMEWLVTVIQELSLARDVPTVITIVRHAAWTLTSADGASFVLREGDLCYYADVEAIGPLWKGQRFPMQACISGWVMLHRQHAVIEDIYADPRIPTEAYEPTFVKSLVMVPIRILDPIGVIGTYWARPYRASAEEVRLLQALADSTSVALENISLYQELEQRVAERTAELQQSHEELRREIVERQRMQEALFQREKLAALGTLLANVAHELNNPLAVATMQLDNLQEEGGSDAWADDLETLRQAIERCKSVVQSFLSLARQHEPTRHAVALNAVIGDVLVLLQHPLEVDNITVHLQLDEQVPPVWADANQLHHVVANLMANAHHALLQTSPPRHLRLTTVPTADRRQVLLEAADTGPGIPEELQRRIFEPFFTTKPEGVGSGLGLPLCRNIVEGHGGTIHLTSQLGQGTTVRVTLPIATSDVLSPEASPEPVVPAQTASVSILLIDDERGLQRALSRLLQRRGYNITIAANGLEGLAALEERSYAAILCDIRMPGLAGPGFYRQLAQRHPHLVSRIIFLTGDTLSPETQAFFTQVDCRRLIKPFNAQDVRRVIQQVLEAP